MLFTHFGVSGPVILSGSRHVINHNPNECKLIIDLNQPYPKKSFMIE